MALQDSNPSLTSKKRARPSSFSGIFTRKRSQVYLHCNRSGRTRSDTQKLQVNPPQSFRKRPRRRSVDTDDEWSRILIRDLRSRRVFSPGSSEINAEMKKSAEGSEDGSGIVVMSDVLCVKDDVKVIENGEFKESKTGYLDANVECVREGFRDGFGGLKEEDCLQSTPPDTETFGCRILHNQFQMGSKKANAEKNDRNMEKKNGSTLETKFILSPCSRVRVFKAPGSFSYRRLLPFLVDMARENSCVERKLNLDDQQVPTMDQSQLDFSVTKSQNDISAHLSQKLAIGEKQRIELEESEKGDDLQNLSPQCSSQCENLNSDCNDDAKATDNAKINDELSCNVEVRSDKVQELSLNSDKDFENRKEEACRLDNHETRPMDCQHAKEFKTADPFISLSDSIEKKDDNDGGDQDKFANLNEEQIQVAQAAVEIDDKAGVHENTNISIGNAIQSSNQLPQNPTDRSIYSNDGSERVKTVASNYQSNLGLSPCAKLKRFRTPNSFNYKRMLPYLKEITKGDSGNTQSQDSREVNQPSTLSSDIHEIPTGEQNANCSQEMQIVTETATNHASNRSCSSLVSSEQLHGISGSLGSLEQEFQVTQSEAEKEKQYLCAVGGGGCETTIKDRHCAKAVVGISQNSSQLDGFDPFRIAYCFRKSILKRNPRGCRGLCNCLNCASFRLHAERAFEFSKNQMHDAEEIALNLVSELSQLRNLLEETVFNSDANSDVTRSHQVKEACKKASEAEEVAKGRLREMIYDVNVHCRIPCSQPPRVTFAMNERVISETLQSNTEEKALN